MAIQDETGPVLVTVFCDNCGVEVTHDYLVPAGQDSLAVARRCLAADYGWEITPGTDLCLECKGDDEPTVGAASTVGAEPGSLPAPEQN